MTYKLFYEREFDAAHYLHLEYTSKCTEVHGHRWKVQFHIETDTLNDAGMVVDYVVLKNLVDSLDHSFINDLGTALDPEDPDAALLRQPTAEHLAEYFYEHVLVPLKYGHGPYNAHHVKVTVWEGPNSSVSVEGGGGHHRQL